jgi:hypothetical protein
MAEDLKPARGDGTLVAKIEKNVLFILGGIVIGSFMSGIGAMLFIQRVVRSEIDDHWKGQLTTLAKTAVDEQIKAKFGSREPALVRQFKNGLNECVRVNNVQYCWGRETKTPKWDSKASTNTLEHNFRFAASFEGTPVVTVGAYADKNQKIWAVFSSSRTTSGLLVRAQDITKGASSEEHVFVHYIAVGTPANE